MENAGFKLWLFLCNGSTSIPAVFSRNGSHNGPGQASGSSSCHLPSISCPLALPAFRHPTCNCNFFVQKRRR